MKESIILKNLSRRTSAFQPNQTLDQLIGTLRQGLEPAQQAANNLFEHPKLPVILLVGCPRAGITFTSQLLAATGAFAYPSNFLSRFSFAPYYGALIQRMLFEPEFDFGHELKDLNSLPSFSSTLGKTEGALSINEFFHFWRRFFPNHEPEHLTPEQLGQVDVCRLRAELASIESVFQKPFAAKGKMFQQNLEHFIREMPEIRIIHIKRSPCFVMQSIYLSRLKYYGTEKIWWSVKPEEYEALSRLDPLQQIAGQVFHTDSGIEAQTHRLPQDKVISTSYEEICAAPRQFIQQVSAHFSIPALTASSDKIKDRYESNNHRKIEASVFQQLQSHYDKLECAG